MRLTDICENIRPPRNQSTALSSQARVPGAGKWPPYVYLANVTPEFINQSQGDCDSHKIFQQLLKKIFTLNIFQLGEREVYIHEQLQLDN